MRTKSTHDRARASAPAATVNPASRGCRRAERLARDHGVMSGTVTPDREVPARLPRVGYIPALDGLRALAVVAVLLYHGDVKWMPGGFLGVDVFFVISGYLITSLLLGDWREHNKIRFAAVLPPARPATAPCPLPDDGRRRPLRVAVPPRHGRGVAGPVGRRALVRRELVSDLPRRLVRRRGRSAGLAEPRLVARGGGAVLSPLADHLRVPARALGSAAQQVAPRGRRRRARVDRAHGGAVRAVHRSATRLLRH